MNKDSQSAFNRSATKIHTDLSLELRRRKISLRCLSNCLLSESETQRDFGTIIVKRIANRLNLRRYIRQIAFGFSDSNVRFDFRMFILPFRNQSATESHGLPLSNHQTAADQHEIESEAPDFDLDNDFDADAEQSDSGAEDIISDVGDDEVEMDQAESVLPNSQSQSSDPPEQLNSVDSTVPSSFSQIFTQIKNLHEPFVDCGNDCFASIHTVGLVETSRMVPEPVWVRVYVLLTCMGGMLLPLATGRGPPDPR